jgi:O-antigen/teichoic acid export membrane protein
MNDARLADGQKAAPDNRKLALGAGILAIASFVKMGLQLGSLPIMARLLGPSEFGLYGIVLPVVAFVSMLADGGLGMSLVREPESSDIWSTAFWALLGTGALLSGLLTGWGFLLSEITHERRVWGLLATLSISLIFMTTTVPPLARLDRQGRIGVGATADLIGSIVGTLVGVGFALCHAGAWSLVFQYLTNYALRSAIVNWAAFQMPRLEWKPRLLLGHLTTGGQVMGGRVADFAGRMLESLAMGQTLGINAVGLYTFSNQVCRFITDAVGSPLWMSLYIKSLHQDGESIRALQKQLARLFCILLFPVTVIVSASAREFVVPLLGQKWDNAVPLIQILFPCYVFMSLGSQTGAVLLAQGGYSIQVWGLALFGLIKVGCIALGSKTGLQGVTTEIAVTSYAYSGFMIAASATRTGLKPLHLIYGLYGPFLAGLTSWIATYLIIKASPHDFKHTIEASVIGFVFYVGALTVIDNKRVKADLRLAYSLLKRTRLDRRGLARPSKVARRAAIRTVTLADR